MMEGLALILFFLTLIGIIANIILIIYSIIKKDFKYRPKKLSIVLIGFIVAFIGSTIFYGAVQTPESKAKYEANQKAKAEAAAAQKELAEQEKKVDEEKLKEKEQQIKEVTKTIVEEKPVKDNKVEVEVKEESPKADDRFVIKSEPNTSAAVDEFYYKAKKDAITATEENLKEAIKFISDNYNNYWTDNEKMHKTMYYGYLLESAKKDKAKENQKGIDYTIYSLGTDAVQVVKYVYRNADKIDDAATKSNLDQIKKSLNKIPSEYKK